jgi:eukaryotic-like serine/threonine-protein kinase
VADPGTNSRDKRPPFFSLAREERVLATLPSRAPPLAVPRSRCFLGTPVQDSIRMRHNALVGRKVAGRFTIKRFLGEGGMAIVYVAEQDAEPREVALKIMNQELTNDRSFVRRFQREAKASSRVQHPNSVKIIDFGVEDGLSYIAMELLAGDDLYVLLEREGAISQARAARILAEVCDALMVAHELGIVHRDLKPENVMVVPDPGQPSGERVKVLDFGIAKILAADAIAEEKTGSDSRDPNSAVTRAGTFIGTPAYMSPEQCSLQTVDTRADIYTCGVLLFQLVTGQLPFEGQTPLHTATLHIHQAAPAPSTLAPSIDKRLEALILKALAKRPGDRHQTARHLGTALRKLLPELPDVRVGTNKPSKRPSTRAQSVASVAVTEVKAPGPPPPPSLGAPVSDPMMDSAKTMVVADGVPLAPASVVVHDEPPASSSDPPARIQAPPLVGGNGSAQPPRPALRPLPPPPPPDEVEIDDDDDPSDNLRTLVRPSLPDGPPGTRTLPSEAMAPLGPPGLVPLKPASNAPPAPVPVPAPLPVPAPAPAGVAPIATTMPAIVSPAAAPPSTAEPSQPRRLAPMAFAETQPVMDSPEQLAALKALRAALPPDPPPAAPVNPLQMNPAYNMPMPSVTARMDSPLIPGSPMAPRSPAAPSSAFLPSAGPSYPEPKSRAERAAALSGARGLAIGFIFGVLIVGVLVVVYLIVLRGR